MKTILALLAIVLAILATPVATQAARPVSAQIVSGPVLQCASATGEACVTVRLEDLSLSGGDTLSLSGQQTIILRDVIVPSRALPLSRPLMVSLTAMASSELSWNGIVIGRNGVPGPNSAAERPGRFIASFVVPSPLVRPGRNIVSARLSAHHLWLPVHSQVHVFEVGPYETSALPGLRTYLPALLALGALAAAGIYFATAAAFDRRDWSAFLLALIALSAALQLLTETSRTFIAYTYPWHLARVGAIALLAAISATLIAAWAAQRFAPEWQRRATLGTAAAAAAAVVLLPWFDLKALSAILAGAVALLVCGGRGLRHEVPQARLALAGGGVFILLMVYQRTEFLDRAYYLAIAAALVALVAEQVLILRRSRQGHDAERRRSAGLEDRLSEARRGGENIVLLKDGARVHRVAVTDILFAKAADDYCEVQLVGGRSLLSTTTLARLNASLPPAFVRVHKSYVVNGAHVAAVSPRPGGGRMVTLTGGISVPVGRTYGDPVSAWTSAPPAACSRQAPSIAVPDPDGNGS